MPSFRVILGLSISLFASTLAHGRGVGSTAGGKAVVCRNRETNAIESATILDLFEATERYGYEIRKTGSDLETELAKFLEIYENSTMDTLSSSSSVGTVDLMQALRKFRPSEGPLTPQDDLGTTFALTPAGCQLEQVAVFHDPIDDLFVDWEIWNALDPLNQAALLAHEAIYKQMRIGGAEKTSELTRRLVGLLFSTTPPKPRKEMNLDKMVSCDSTDEFMKSTHFYISNNGNSSSLFIDRIGGRASIVPLEVKVPVALSTASLNRVFGKTMVEKAPAEFQGNLAVLSVPYEDFKVELNYRSNEPFTIKVIDGEDRVLSDGYIMTCSSPN